MSLSTNTANVMQISKWGLAYSPVTGHPTPELFHGFNIVVWFLWMLRPKFSVFDSQLFAVGFLYFYELNLVMQTGDFLLYCTIQRAPLKGLLVVVQMMGKLERGFRSLND